MDYSAAQHPAAHDASSDEPAHGAQRASRAKAIAAITLGNGLEFFDFTIYSFFASCWALTRTAPAARRR